MTRLLLVPFLLALVCGPQGDTRADPQDAAARPVVPGILSIEGATEYDRDKLVRLEAKGVDAKAGLIWRVYPRDKADRADSPRGTLQFAGAPGKYEIELLVVTVDKNGGVQVEEAFKTVNVKAGGGALPPPKDKDPPIVPPIDTPGTSLYFLIVRPDGPAHPDFTRNMQSPQWETLLKQGHQVKDKTLSELPAYGITLPPGTVLPCVVTLRIPADWKTFTIVRGPIPLPVGDAILKLPEGL